ncbi:hypothetical protein C5Z26_04100 [Lactobacillus sp. CBA3606]|uniref:glycosyltransferase n=1 Tax=Lactobacillus sp. CBA3606 TaxID=2099789 RepID=UPI000CFA8AB8|nr:glycosyltransferase [Lactobacillus sp. CBA3606]AVK63330.1 hypothetical protein C5Z26_04100 [Lactobacillus sp. CBA3606]
MKKKIAFLIPQFYWGGMPHVASELIGLLKPYYEITLILVNNKLPIRVDTHAVQVVHLKGKKIGKFFDLKRVLTSNRFSVVISFGIIDNLLNIILTPKRVRRIITEHSTKSFDNEIEKSKIKKFIYQAGIKHIYPKADSIVAVSDGIKADLVENFSLKNIQVIYNPLAKNEKQPSLKLEDKMLIDRITKGNGKIVLNVGRITTPKGQMNLVHGFKFLKHENIHLILIGEGPDSRNIKKYINQNGMQDYVHVIGSRNNVLTWMEQCDLYVSLSWFEGFPGALVEAVKSKLPVISADIFSGPREILSQGKDTNYNDKAHYPVQLPNGVLTQRFDFRNDETDFNQIEADFSKQIKFFIDYKTDSNYRPNLGFISNRNIVNQYIKLIEGKEEK